MTKKSIIDTYECIYPVKLVVTNKYTTVNKLKQLYTYSDGTILDERILDGKATATRVNRISDNKACVLIKLNEVCGKEKNIDLIESAVHEAAHFCLDTYSYIEEEINVVNQETFTYFIAWATCNVLRTWMKK